MKEVRTEGSEEGILEGRTRRKQLEKEGKEARTEGREGEK